MSSDGARTERKPKSGLAVGLNRGHVRSQLHPQPLTVRLQPSQPSLHPQSQNFHNLQNSQTNTHKQKVTPIQTPRRISRSKGHLSKRTAFVREIVKEVAGLAPYERRVIELLRNSKDKRARKLAKKRVCITTLFLLGFWWEGCAGGGVVWRDVGGDGGRWGDGERR